MKARRLLPYLIALLLLAWILGSLARSGTGGGSLLAYSYWLIYTVELLPVIALGLLVVMIIELVVHWRLISDALAFGMSRKRRTQKKKSNTVQTIIFIAAWTMAGVILLVRCGGLVCKSNSETTAGIVGNLVAGSGPLPVLPALGPVLALASLVDTNLFVIAFYGILAVSSVIMARAVMVHLNETRRESVVMAEAAQEHGREAVRDAIRLLDEDGNGDAKTRILACYQRMIKAASDLGAPVGPDKTARELERGIRSMFTLKGPGIASLTGLFEEARYSLHPITEENAVMARECLVEINAELNRTVIVEA